MSPRHAIPSMTTRQDIEVLKRVLPVMYEMNTSLTRPAGTIVPIHIWWAEHEKPIGDFNEHTFRKALMPTLKEGVVEPKSLEDYDVPSLEALKAAGIPTDAVEDLCVKYVSSSLR